MYQKDWGGRKEDANAVASQPQSPPKETIDTGDNKYHSAPKVLTQVKGSKHIFYVKFSDCT